MFEREGAFLEKHQNSVDKGYSSLLKKSRKIIFGTKLICGERLLGLVYDESEGEYLVTSMAWNICRKRCQDIEYLSKHPTFDIKDNILLTLLKSRIDNKIRINDEILSKILEDKNEKAKNVSPAMVNVIDRATNMLSMEYLNLHRPGQDINQGYRRIDSVIRSFHKEISNARGINEESVNLTSLLEAIGEVEQRLQEQKQ